MPKNTLQQNSQRETPIDLKHETLPHSLRNVTNRRSFLATGIALAGAVIGGQTALANEPVVRGLMTDQQVREMREQWMQRMLQTDRPFEQVYAPPAVFGNWQTVSSHIGPMKYAITVEPIGDTKVFGEIRYYNKEGKQVVKPFHDKVEIEVGNSIANVEVRLKGVPTGSSCKVFVTP